ncbi:hypothetical protein [Kitasatospora griseola]|uniref:hypothetical protein n=1 Tax=Kitasatospora griseola TaxID=2064 RepID=UPI00166FA299|nr:hypothetical protein [Kitasatospora griseola]GGQ80390.1 hypothetical protein GCM10010195_40090 [Kitasatospora griseola]
MKTNELPEHYVSLLEQIRAIHPENTAHHAARAELDAHIAVAAQAQATSLNKATWAMFWGSMALLGATIANIVVTVVNG